MLFIIFKFVFAYLTIGLVFTIGMWDRISVLSKILGQSQNGMTEKEHKKSIVYIHIFLWPIILWQVIKLMIFGKPND